MKIAIPHWRGRVSPVFDVARNVLFVDVDGGAERSRRDAACESENLLTRAAWLAGAGAEVLICGAISWPLEVAVRDAGVDVIAQTCGDVEQVLSAFVKGQLRQDTFLMPGCCGRRRRFRTQGRHGKQSRR